MLSEEFFRLRERRWGSLQRSLALFCKRFFNRFSLNRERLVFRDATIIAIDVSGFASLFRP